MHEINEKGQDYYCECCHCKKIFMLIVLLILSFIAGIMVGCCNSNNHGYMPVYSQQMMPQRAHPAKFHRGAHPTNAETPAPQTGGFVFEVESSD